MGNATLDYKDFDAKRREFLSAKSMKEEVGQASLRYYVPKKARTQYFDRISSRPGLSVAFSDEDNCHATARVRYNGAPGRTVEYQVFVTDGTVRQTGVEKTQKTLTDGKSFKFDVERTAGQSVLDVLSALWVCGVSSAARTALMACLLQFRQYV